MQCYWVDKESRLPTHVYWFILWQVGYFCFDCSCMKYERAAATSFWGVIGLNKNKEHSGGSLILLRMRKNGRWSVSDVHLHFWNTAMPRAPPHPPLPTTIALDSLPPCCMFSNLIRLHTHYFYFFTAAASQSLFNCFLLTKCRWSLDSRPTALKSTCSLLLVL